MASSNTETSNNPKKQVSAESEIEKVSLDSTSGGAKKESDAASDSSIAILDAGRRAVEERRLLRKLDMRLMPMIILIYLMNYIDVSPCTQ